MYVVAINMEAGIGELGVFWHAFQQIGDWIAVADDFNAKF